MHDSCSIPSHFQSSRPLASSTIHNFPSLIKSRVLYDVYQALFVRSSPLNVLTLHVCKILKIYTIKVAQSHFSNLSSDIAGGFSLSRVTTLMRHHLNFLVNWGGEMTFRLNYQRRQKCPGRRSIEPLIAPDLSPLRQYIMLLSKPSLRVLFRSTTS